MIGEEQLADRQFVDMELHRRRSVLVRMSQAGERLETVRIVNDVDRLAAVSPRAWARAVLCLTPSTGAVAPLD